MGQLSRDRGVIGVVVSSTCQSVVKVEVARRGVHPMFGKVVVYSKRFLCRNKGRQLLVGESVVLLRSRRLSKRISWVVEPVVPSAVKGGK